MKPDKMAIKRVKKASKKMGRPPTGRKQVTVYLQPGLWRRVRIAAIQQGIKASDMVEKALLEHLKRSK